MKILAVIVGILVLLFAAAWLKLRGPDIPYENLEAKYADGASHFIDLPGGIRLHYQEHGKADAPLVLLLHGFGDSYTSWEHWLPVLDSTYRVITLDFPGHGLTRAPEGYALSSAGLVDVVENFASAAHLPKFAVVGNSMGGGVAWKFAATHPERLTALVLVDAAGFPNDTPPGDLPVAFKLLRYSWGRALLRNIDNRPLIDSGLKIDVYDKTLITPALVDRWAEFQRAPGHRAVLMSINPVQFAEASPAVLGTISAPTLILHGEEDVLIEPKSAQKFSNAIGGSKVIMYPHVGHLPQIEIPDKSASDVAAFLSTLPAVTAPVAPP